MSDSDFHAIIADQAETIEQLRAELINAHSEIFNSEGGSRPNCTKRSGRRNKMNKSLVLTLLAIGSLVAGMTMQILTGDAGNIYVMSVVFSTGAVIAS